MLQPAPLIEEPVAKALPKAPFEWECEATGPAISHVPPTLFICHGDGVITHEWERLTTRLVIRTEGETQTDDDPEDK